VWLTSTGLLNESSDVREMNSKPYNGYKSFEYLIAGEDYKQFDLPPDVGRVPGYDA